MGKFFPDGVLDGSGAPGYNPMTQAVKLLSPKARQAMYAVLKNGGTMARKTWNGCAFNAASGGSVRSVAAAAAAFEMRSEDVSRFIGAWDKLYGRNETANRILLEAIENYGTHTPNGRVGKVFRMTVYKSEATKFAEQLESGELTLDMIPGCEEAGELLSV